jgi:hypothetical protein
MKRVFRHCERSAAIHKNYKKSKTKHFAFYHDATVDGGEPRLSSVIASGISRVAIHLLVIADYPQ